MMELLAHAVHKVLLARRVIKVNAVTVEKLVVQVCKVSLVHPEPRVRAVMLVELVTVVKRVLKVNPVHKVPKVQSVCQVHLDNQVKLDPRVNPVNEDNLVHLEVPVF